jgi:hypothetical protein
MESTGWGRDDRNTKRMEEGEMGGRRKDKNEDRENVLGFSLDSPTKDLIKLGQVGYAYQALR